MQIETTGLDGVPILTPACPGDTRVNSSEGWNCRRLTEAGINVNFVQDKHPLSMAEGSVLGWHLQAPSHAQTKPVRCGRGPLWNIAANVRRGSPAFGQWGGDDPGPENGRQLFMSAGFLHGFATRALLTEIIDKCSDCHARECDGAVRFDNPEIGDGQPLFAERLHADIGQSRIYRIGCGAAGDGARAQGGQCRRADLRSQPRQRSIGRRPARQPLSRATYAPGAVMQLAATAHLERSIDSRGALMETDVMRSCTLQEAVCHCWQDAGWPEAFRLHRIATDETYGAPGAAGQFTAEAPDDPRSPYSASRANLDHPAPAPRDTYGLPVVLTNCSNNSSPYHFPGKLAPVAILDALAGRDTTIYSAGNNVRGWLCIADHADALMLESEKGATGCRLGIGSERDLPSMDPSMTCGPVDRQRPDARPNFDHITDVDGRPGHDARLAIDPTRIREELGWRRSVTVGKRLELTGLYLPEGTPPEQARSITPSPRSDLEITTLPETYLVGGQLDVTRVGRDYALLETGKNVPTLKKRQGRQSGHPEEIACDQSRTDRGEAAALAKIHARTECADYLTGLLN